MSLPELEIDPNGQIKYPHVLAMPMPYSSGGGGGGLEPNSNFWSESKSAKI